MTTLFTRLSRDQRYGLKANGEFHLIGQKMIGYLPDEKDFEEAVEREEMRRQALLPVEAEEKEETF